MKGMATNVKTPLLIPSFSSKVRLDIDNLLQAMAGNITESLLLSAYDLSYEHVGLPTSAFAEVLFLDSGGYEASKDLDVAYLVAPPGNLQPWTINRYKTVLTRIDPIMPTFVTSFDHPEVRQPIAEQINSAVQLFKTFPGLGREILIKPEQISDQFISVSSLGANVIGFDEFDVIGVTEKELGASVLQRMTNIARIRYAMDSAQVHKPLHVYGSLDPVCTPLYFLAGADIFDGLTWLRHGYRDDIAIYHGSHNPLQLGITDRDELNNLRTCSANLNYMSKVKRNFLRYFGEGDMTNLGLQSEFFTRSLRDLRAEVGGIV